MKVKTETAGRLCWRLIRVHGTSRKRSPFEFDTQDGHTPALVKIDSTHYLCAYTGSGSDGWVVVLGVNGASWTVSKYTPFEYDTQNGEYTEPDLDEGL